METVAVYAGFVAAGSVVVLAVLKAVERINDFPRKACLFGAVVMVTYGLVATPADALLFHYLGILLFAEGLPPRWGIYPAGVAVIGLPLLNLLEVISFTEMLLLVACAGPVAAVIGLDYWREGN